MKGRNVTIPGGQRGQSRMMHAALRGIAGLCLCLLGVSAQGQSGAGQSPSVPLSAGRSAKDVAVITVHGVIDAWTAFSIKRRIERAERDGADAIVFEINSPGGGVGAVEIVCNAIKASQVSNTVAWVRPQAYSGGAIIALACKEIIVTEHAQFGDALPVAFSPMTGLVNLPDAEREKFIGPLLAEVVDSARRNGYDEMLVQRFVRRGVELWLIEHPQTGEIYFATEYEATAALGTAPDRTNPRVPSVTGPVGGSGPAQPVETGIQEESLRGPEAEGTPLDFLPADPRTPEATRRFVDGELQERGQASRRPDFRTPEHAGRYRLVEYVGDGHGLLIVHAPEMLRYRLAVGTINTDEEMAAFFGAQNVVRLNETWSEGLARFLTQSWVRGLLIAVFLVCLFVEMTHPGVTAPGLVAALALLALIVPPVLVNMAAWWEILAILLGIVLIGMELFVLPGIGVFGVLGVIFLFGGLIGTFVGGGGLFPDSAQGRSELSTGVLTVVISAIASGGIMYMIAKHLPSTPLLNRLILKETLADGESTTMLSAMSQHTGTIAVGTMGRAMTPLRPSGRVLIGDELVDAVAEYGFVPAGATVRVISSDGFRTAVEVVEGGTEQAGNPGSA